MTTVAIIQTGVANTASVTAAFRRIGCDVEVLRDAKKVSDAEFLVLPGVGAFGAGIDALRRLEIVEIVQKRISARRPTLAICLGLQLLASSSEETKGVEGLRGFDADVVRMRSDRTHVVPQMGWNEICGSSRFVEPGWAYFANTFAVKNAPEGWVATTYDHGEEYIASLERGSVLACQFHPELSGVWGSNVLKKWVSSC